MCVTVPVCAGAEGSGTGCLSAGCAPALQGFPAPRGSPGTLLHQQIPFQPGQGPAAQWMQLTWCLSCGCGVVSEHSSAGGSLSGAQGSVSALGSAAAAAAGLWGRLKGQT